jgi:hypothetical protein
LSAKNATDIIKDPQAGQEKTYFANLARKAPNFECFFIITV